MADGYQHHGDGPACGRGVHLANPDHAQHHAVDGDGDNHQDTQDGYCQPAKPTS